MTDHDRREFLTVAMTAAGFAATSSWCTRWFQPQDPTDTARERQLRAAATKAKQQGKPLLVFVAPGKDDKDQDEVHARGRWFGAFLNHGGPLALLEVALCVPACATVDEVRKVTGAATIDGLPLLLVVDVSGLDVEGAPPPKVTRLDLDLGAPVLPGKGRSYEPEDIAANKQHIVAGLERLTTELHKTVHQHGQSLAALAAAVTARLDDAERTALAAWVRTGNGVADDQLVRATAELRRQFAEVPDDVRTAAQERLVVAIERNVVRKPLPNGRWYTSGGCGARPEEPTEAEQDGPSVACGMGMVPEYCERFLAFYSQS